MIIQKNSRQHRRKVRHARVRAKISGTAERPRLNIHRSLLSLFVQLIDDTRGVTLLSVHSKTVGKEPVEGKTGRVATSYLVGKELAARAKEQGVTTVVFDRGGYAYHGRVAAFAEGARDGGLIF